MATGDLIVSPWQWEIRDLLGGAGTIFDNGPEGWGGLGLPPVKSNGDLDLDLDSGTFQGPDRLTSRILTFPIIWGGAGADDVFLDLAALMAAWGPSTVDVDLAFSVPGWGRCRVTGKPRGLVEDLRNAPRGEARALATFVAGDPTVVFLDPVGS